MKLFIVFILGLLCHRLEAQQIFYKQDKWGYTAVDSLDSIVKKINVDSFAFIPYIHKRTIKKDSIIYNWHFKAQDAKLNKPALKKISTSFFAANYYNSQKQVIKKDSLKNKIILIMFWADFCLPCIKEIGVLNDIAALYKNNKQVLFLAPCSNTENKCDAIAKKFSFNYFIVNNKQTNFLEHIFGVSSYPLGALIDQNGTVKIIFHIPAAVKPGVKSQDEPLYLTLTTIINSLLK
jgi:thiol-disulfide isomerase/thioredoxin